MTSTSPMLESGDVTNRVVTGPVRSVMIALVLPVLAEQFLNTLVGLVDTFLAGNLPEMTVEATSAVGLASYVGWLMTMLFALVGMGTTALVARAYGANDRHTGVSVANQSMMLSVIMGLLGAALMYTLAPHFAAWQAMHGRTYDITVHYLRIDAIGYAGSALTLVGSAALRGAGDMRTPMKVMILVNLFNVILSPLLVFGPGPVPTMHVDGIVTGTVCARLLGGALITYVFLHGKAGLKLKAGMLMPHLVLARRILRIGGPAAVDGAIMWTGHFLFLRIVGLMGGNSPGDLNHAYAAQIVVVRLEAFTYLPAAAWSAACATMIGQALGAGLPERAKRSGHEGVMQCGILTALIGVIFFALATPICGLMNRNPLVIETAAPVLMLAAVFQPVLAAGIVYIGSLRGAGDTVFPMIFNAAAIMLVRLPFGYLFGLTLGYGLLGAWVGVCGDMVLKMILALVRFQRGRWVATRV